MKIQIGTVVGELTAEEFICFDKNTKHWWFRCSCGNSSLWTEQRIHLATKAGRLLACAGCRKRAKAKLKHESKQIRRSQEPGKNTFVYLIHCKGTDNYKIGYSNIPEKRLADIQTSNATKVVLLENVRATTLDELRLHQQFERNHLRGEWFRFSVEKLEEVQEAFAKLKEHV